MSQPAETPAEGGLNLDTTTIMIMVGCLVAGLVIGTFVVAPAKDKLIAAKKKKQESTPATT